ncbi:hypothetical protein, partial [Flavobacterium frigidimaris]
MEFKKIYRKVRKVFFYWCVYAVYLSSQGFMSKNLRTLRKTFAHLAVKYLNLGFQNWNLKKIIAKFAKCFFYWCVYAVYLSSQGFMNKNLRTLHKTFAHL